MAYACTTCVGGVVGDIWDIQVFVFCLQLIMPGYCVAGTIGHKVLSGAKKIEIDKKMVNVRLSVQYMSFRCA